MKRPITIILCSLLILTVFMLILSHSLEAKRVENEKEYYRERVAEFYTHNSTFLLEIHELLIIDVSPSYSIATNRWETGENQVVRGIGLLNTHSALEERQKEKLIEIVASEDIVLEFYSTGLSIHFYPCITTSRAFIYVDLLYDPLTERAIVKSDSQYVEQIEEDWYYMFNEFSK